MPSQSRAPSRLPLRLRGGSCICVGSGGSTPRASAGKPFVTRLIQRIMSGVSGLRSVKKLTAKTATSEARVAREEEEDELLDVAPDGAPLAHGLDDGREVVVRDDHVGRLARDVGAVPAHRDADVRLAQRGRVVHAVARHRDDVAAALERLDDAQLLLRRDAREDAHRLDAARRAPGRRASRARPP